MSQMLNHSQFIRQRTLFKVRHYKSPRINVNRVFEFPRSPLWHFFENDGVKIGPSTTDPTIAAVPEKCYISHVTEFDNPEPRPIPNYGGGINSAITNYTRTHRLFRPLNNLNRINFEEKSLAIFNYSPLSVAWRYPRGKFQEWNMFRNSWGTILKNVVRLSKETNRLQFITVDLPKVRPTITDLRSLKRSRTSSNLEAVPDYDSLVFLDFFFFISNARDESLLDTIPLDLRSKLYFVLRHNGAWISFNLEWLTNLTKMPTSYMGDYDTGSGEYSHQQAETCWLALIEELYTAGNNNGISAIPTLPSSSRQVEISSVDDDMEDVEVEEPPTGNKVDNVKVGKETKKEILEEFSELEELVEVENQDNDDDLYDHEELKRAEKELLELDRIRTEIKERTIEIDDESESISDYIDVNEVTNMKSIVPKLDDSTAITKAGQLFENGLITKNELSRVERLAKKINEIENPYGTKEPVLEFIDVSLEESKLKPEDLSNDKVVIDESLNRSAVDVFEKQYIKKNMKKDVVATMLTPLKSGIAVTGYEVNVVNDRSNKYEEHVIKVVPPIGNPTTIKQIIPVIEDDGTFLYNNTRYRMKKQRVDLPIRKIKTDTVGLTSYYGKVFVQRSPRKRFDYYSWLLRQLEDSIRDNTNPKITNGVISEVPFYGADLPITYTSIAKGIRSFTVADIDLIFDYNDRIDRLKLTKDELKLEKPGTVLIGRIGKNPVLMDKCGTLLENGTEELGTIEELCGIPYDKAPVPIVEMKVYGKPLPVGFCLGYLLGLSNLLKLIKAKPRRVLAGDRLNLTQYEYPVKFNDETLIFDRRDQLTSYIMGSWNMYHQHISLFDVGSFDTKSVYDAILDRNGIGNRFTQELSSMDALFVDHITAKILEYMKEPTDFAGLLVRSVEMLLTEEVPKRRKDVDGMMESLERVRGYERTAGFAYEVMSKAVRQYNARASSRRASVIVNPNDTVRMMTTDATTAPVNNLNPLSYVRDRDVIVVTGRGGRSKRAMVASTRVFHEEEMGFISEGSVDSGDIGIINYLSPNANITSVYGTVKMFDKKKDGAGKIMSTSALLSPTADGDDCTVIWLLQTHSPCRWETTTGILSN